MSVKVQGVVARSKGVPVTLETIVNRSSATPYNHMWSRKGYVSVRHDTVTAPDGTPRTAPVYGSWSFFPEDSTYEYQNLADHVPTNDTQFDQLKAVWTEPVGKTDVFVARCGGSVRKWCCSATPIPTPTRTRSSSGARCTPRSCTPTTIPT